MSMKTIKIFGYGSLINEYSLRRTVPNAYNIFPCRVKGFVRVFNLPTKRRRCVVHGIPIAVLNIEKSEWNQMINGVCFEMDLTHFEDLKQRESSYELIEIEVEDYQGGFHKAFTFRALHFEAYDFVFDSPTQMDYYNLCLEGAKYFGDEFLKEYLETTFIGEETLSKLVNNLSKKDME